MASCVTCQSDVEVGRSHCRACDTPVGDEGSYAEPPPPGYLPPPPQGYAPPPQHGYAPPSQHGHAPPPQHGYAPPSQHGYESPPSGYGQPPAGYPPMPPAAGYGYPPAYGPGPGGYPATAAPLKSKAAAALLCFFLGGFGIHRFYTGQTGLGLALLLTTLFLAWTIIWIPVLLVWLFIDFILILTGGVKDQYGRPLA
ncbi:MAG: TM2 domain-containing protein [Chloroflexi bacterium]|nr:TM2 domain-containing protein [Chloroflexota bacterium]